MVAVCVVCVELWFFFGATVFFVRLTLSGASLSPARNGSAERPIGCVDRLLAATESATATARPANARTTQPIVPRSCMRHLGTCEPQHGARSAPALAIRKGHRTAPALGQVAGDRQ